MWKTIICLILVLSSVLPNYSAALSVAEEEQKIIRLENELEATLVSTNCLDILNYLRACRQTCLYQSGQLQHLMCRNVCLIKCAEAAKRELTMRQNSGR
jgi:hypothetical protein